MSRVEFRVIGCGGQYTVEMYRDSKRYVAFVTGLTKQAAECEAQALAAVWEKIAPGAELSPDFQQSGESTASSG